MDRRLLLMLIVGANVIGARADDLRQQRRDDEKQQLKTPSVSFDGSAGTGLPKSVPALPGELTLFADFGNLDGKGGAPLSREPDRRGVAVDEHLVLEAKIPVPAGIDSRHQWKP